MVLTGPWAVSFSGGSGETEPDRGPALKTLIALLSRLLATSPCAQPRLKPMLLQSWASSEEISNNAKPGMKQSRWKAWVPSPDPLLSLGFEISSNRGWGRDCDSDYLEAPLHGAGVPGPAKGGGGMCSLDGAQPLPDLLLWGCAIMSLTFLVGFICSKRQIPPWEPRWSGPPCQIAQAFTTHRQEGAAGDLGPLFRRRSRRRSCCHSVVPELGGRPRRHFRDPFPHPPGPPSLALELPGCWALGRATGNAPPLSYEGIMEGCLHGGPVTETDVP